MDPARYDEVLHAEMARVTAAQPLLGEERRIEAARAYADLLPDITRAHEAERRYDDSADPSGLEESMWAYRRAAGRPSWAALAPERRGDLAARQSKVARERYETGGDPADLDLAVSLAREAVAAGREAAGHAGTERDVERILLAMASALGLRSLPPETAADIARARRGASRVLPDALTSLGSHLTAAFDREHGRATGDQAVQALLEARALTSGGDLAARVRRRLAETLLMRFKVYGDPADAGDMVAAARDGMVPEGHADRAEAQDCLGTVLLNRSELPGHEDDLDEAVEALEEAVRLRPRDPWSKTNLGAALGRRFKRAGRLGDAERSAELNQAALALIPAGAPDRARVEQNLQAIRAELAAAGAPAGDDRVQAARRMLAATPAGARARPARMGGLAGLLTAAFEQDLDLRGLEEAIALWREAVATCASGSLDRPSLLHGLGRSLMLRYCLLGGRGDLDAAVDGLRRAAGDASSEERANHLLDLAQALSLRAAPAGGGEDDMVSEAFAEAARTAEAGGPGTAVRVCRTWGDWAAERGRLREAAGAMAAALRADERLHRAQAARSHREMAIGVTGPLYVDAAVSLARAGDAEAALLALERGRGRMLAEALDRDRAQLDELERAGRGDLAAAFRRAGARLAALERGGRDTTGGDARAGREAAEEELQRIAAEVRRVPGHALFLAPAQIEEVRTVARDTPLAYVAAGAHGGVAVTADRDGAVTARMLDGVDTEALTPLLVEYLSAQEDRDADPDRWRRALARATEWLGEKAWGPVRAALPDAPSVGVVPCGLLAFLPVHAARLGDGRHAIDDCVVTVVPSARILAACRDLAGRLQVRSLLTVDVADRPGEAPLPHAGQEAAAVLGRFGAGRRLTAGEATAGAVLDALPGHQVLHFACHGRDDLRRPLDSALLLAGAEMIRVSDLMDRRDLAARLAVLSACRTAGAAVARPDELVGLPGALLQAGVAGVIGTLWAITDISGMLLVRRFFDEWKPGGDPARALRAAQLWMRDADNGAKFSAYPDVEALTPPVDPGLRAVWERGRPHADPQHWAAFCYLGW
ncbi:CHAT domain-containing protein [Sphaerisporangium dianthi]|uniref:CHAT domain-containing protein n=1 Tax=Sphaerisporangium dianthi TaxID=1436120 RepID=A0ABV9CVY4_9ACTN